MLKKNSKRIYGKIIELWLYYKRTISIFMKDSKIFYSRINDQIMIIM